MTVAERFQVQNVGRQALYVVVTLGFPPVTAATGAAGLQYGVRSLPEHTVDCWIASAIDHRFGGRALTWAPTQNAVDNWDLAVDLVPHKRFVLENKGCEWHGRNAVHTVQVDVQQLHRWSNPAAPPTFYVIPVPPWARPPVPDPVPSYARCAGRTSGPCHECGGAHPNGVADWTYVLPAAVLNRHVGASSRARTFTRPAAWFRRMSGRLTFAAFLDGLDACDYVAKGVMKGVPNRDQNRVDTDVVSEAGGRGRSGLLAVRITVDG